MNGKSKIFMVGMIVILMVGFLFSNFEQDNRYSKSIFIPKGNAVKIDGVMDKKEWENSEKREFINGEKLLFHHDGEFIYFGIVGKRGGFSSVCLNINEKVYVFHASLGLITAEYLPQQNDWILVKEFREKNQMAMKKIKDNNKLELYSLKTFGWFSNTVNVGDPKIKEYKLMKDKFVNGQTRVSFTHFQIKAKNKLAFAPKNLSDGSKNLSMIRGSNVSRLKFEPETWFTLSW